MIDEKVMNHLLDEFEEVIKKNGVNCMRVTDREEFIRNVHEKEMTYEGFVIVKSSEQSGIFYVNTAEWNTFNDRNEYS